MPAWPAFRLLVCASAALIGGTPATDEHPSATAGNGRDTGEGAAPAPGASYLLTFELPSVDLPAGADHTEAPQPRPVPVAIPHDGWMRGFEVQILDAAGLPVPHDVLHHVQLFDPSRRDLFHPFMLRVAGAGGETGGIRLPWPLAYRVHAGDSLLLGAMVHNPGGEAREGVRVRLRLEMESDGRVRPRMAVFPFFLHVTDPGEPTSYDLPPGRSERGWEGSPAAKGRILGLGGHLHRYGVELVLEDVTAGKVLWRGEPTVADDGSILGVERSAFRLRLGIPVDPERVYRVTAVYDNPTGETLRDGGMGTIGGVVRVREEDWPRARPDHPVYVRDLEAQLSPDAHTGGHAGHHH